MLSKKLHEAMNAQINAELWSAYLYLSMSMDAEGADYSRKYFVLLGIRKLENGRTR